MHFVDCHDTLNAINADSIAAENIRPAVVRKQFDCVSVRTTRLYQASAIITCQRPVYLCLVMPRAR
jgi:hypothetical protein